MSYLKHKYIPFYMGMARDVSALSYCKNAKVGAVILTTNNVLAIGYNGTPAGHDNACEDCNGKTKGSVQHAELNALSKLVQSNESSKGATLFCTLSPCINCAKAIYAAGVKTVYYEAEYKDTEGLDFLRDVGVICTQILQTT